MSVDATTAIPKSVRHAAICLWASAGLAAALTVWQLVWPGATTDIAVVAATGIINAGLLALVAAKIRSRRAWAWWLFVVLYVFGLFAFILSVFLVPQEFRSLPTLLQASGVVQFLLQTAALLLLFTSASLQWLKATPAAITPP